MYFVEQEKKRAIFFDKMNSKIKYYKEQYKAVLQQKHKFDEKLESMNDILFSYALTSENLNKHKKLIHDLLSTINEKREEIYLKNSNIEILEKEIKLWIYNFDSIKISPEIRVILDC